MVGVSKAKCVKGSRVLQRPGTSLLISLLPALKSALLSGLSLGLSFGFPALPAI